MFKMLFLRVRVKGILTIFVGSIFLIGCTTLNKSECLNADWVTIGYQDGYKGESQSRIGKHRKACAEYGVKPVLKQYLDGYKKGVTEFCRPYRGYRRGLLGYVNRGVCKGSMRTPYNHAYQQGKQLYNLEQQIIDTQEIINNISEINNNLEYERQFAEQKLINYELTKARRAQLVERIRDIDNKKLRNIDRIEYHEGLLNSQINEVKYLKEQNHFKNH